MLAVPDLVESFDVSATWLTVGLFVVPFALSLGLETALLVATARLARPRLVQLALLAMSLGQLAILFAPGWFWFTVATTTWILGAGVATQLAEVALVDGDPEPDRTLSRWALSGTLGDLAGPLVFAAVTGFGLDWRAVLEVNAAVGLLLAAGVDTRTPRGTAAAGDDEEEVPWTRALVELSRTPAVWAWLAAAAACTFFDELFVAFGSLWLRGRGVGPAEQGAAFVLLSLGGVLGLALTERWLLARLGARRVLLGCSAALLLLYPAWLLLPSPANLAVGLLLGMAITPMWPLTTARAYATTPRPALVAALQQVFVPVDLLAPLVVGLVADHAGLGLAMTVLLAQVLVVGGVAARLGRARSVDGAG